MAHGTPRQAEFSRLVRRDRLLEGESQHEIEATAEERQALAKRFDLLSLDRLQARLRLRPQGGAGGKRGLVRLSGHFEAELVQACVVTLEPVRSRLAEDFELLYSLAPEPSRREAEVVVSLDEEEPPEPVGPEGLDLGEAVAQQLALAINPYPRAEGAELAQAEWPRRAAGEEKDKEAGEGAGEGPFQALRSLKRGR